MSKKTQKQGTSPNRTKTPKAATKTKYKQGRNVTVRDMPKDHPYYKQGPTVFFINRPLQKPTTSDRVKEK
ncbi:MAG: hypothetical protein CMJ20_05790 [Phycisphaeraceae bacterium]|nr:hypothetical protein [Phycisphaeraceae bacterium]|tara:strand:- start:186 stop:395 length:210 start_codon:yes stop_codon:yes gene_type:complete